jgi:hypothetical protein
MCLVKKRAKLKLSSKILKMYRQNLSQAHAPRDVKLFHQVLLPRRPGASQPKLIGPPIPTSAHNFSFSTHYSLGLSQSFFKEKKIKMMHVFNKKLVMYFKLSKKKLFENQIECMYLIK